MADLPYIQEAQEVKITGQDSTGNTSNFVQADANGNLAVKDYATSGTGSAVPTNASYIAGQDNSGNLHGIATDSNGQLIVSPLTDASIVTTLPEALVTSQSYPDPSTVTGSSAQIYQDSFGSLQTRGAVLTDEGAFRDDFSGSALTTALTGTLTFVNGNTNVTGSGTAFTTQIVEGQYIKVTAQTEAQYTQVSYVVSDTQLVLVQGYIGASASGVASVISNWKTTTASGTGSITVGSSNVTLASGATNGQSSGIKVFKDYAPLSMQSAFSISQRVANQTTVFGFVDVFPTPNQQVTVQFSGTNNTTCSFIVASSTAAADSITIAVTLPNGSTTATSHIYRVDVSQRQATLFIDGLNVASTQAHLPGPYSYLYANLSITNSATVTTTSVVSDYIFILDQDRVEVTNAWMGETVAVNIVDGGVSSAVSQALTTTINVKPIAGLLYGYTISNPNPSPTYVEYYNTATTPGTIGSTTNLVLEIMIPANATANLSLATGISFSSGIAVAVATTATGNTAPATGLVITTMYK